MKIEKSLFGDNNYERIYLVEFNSYTNALNDTVAKYSKDEINNTVYIHIPETGLLVRESELLDYAEFGNGFKFIKCVGSIYKQGNNY